MCVCVRVCVCRCAGHAGDGVLHGHDGTHDTWGDVLCAAGPILGKPATLPAGHPCAGRYLQPHLHLLSFINIPVGKDTTWRIMMILVQKQCVLPSFSTSLLTKIQKLTCKILQNLCKNYIFIAIKSIITNLMQKTVGSSSYSCVCIT